MLLNFLFPRRCLGCGQWGQYFCSQCLNRLSLNSQRICPICEKPSINGVTHAKCLTPHSLDGLTSVFSYRGLIKKAIRKLKYRFVSDLAKDLIEAFLSFCGEDKTFTHFCRKENLVFLPVPLHPRRKRWRGFNQAELLGEMICKNLGLPFLPNLLLRIKNTKPQTQLDEKERKKNIKGAFKINSKYSIRVDLRAAQKDLQSLNSVWVSRNQCQSKPTGLKLPSNVLLFDDVWTTGTTLRECGKVLKRAGVKKVWGLTLAR